MNILKQSTAATIKLGPFVDDGDGKTVEDGLTISQADIRLSKNGGDIAQTNNSTGATHDELGYYNVPLDATDTNTLGRLLVAVHESGALPVWQEFLVVTANVYDTLCSTDTFDVNVTSLADDVITAGKFDESTAYPLKSADTGSTQVARVGADSDTLETLSDEIAAVKAETASILEDTGTTIPATITTIDNEIAVIDGNVDAIKAKTDNLPADPADDSDIDAQLAAIKAETASILEDTGTTIPATLADLALEATLTAMKGTGWTDETLVALKTAIEAVTGGSGATAQEVWEYATRVLTAGTNLPTAALIAEAVWHESTLGGMSDGPATMGYDLKAAADAIKAKTDNLPEDNAYFADLASNLEGSIKTMDDKVDSILEDTGTTLPTTLGTLATAANLATLDGKVDTVDTVADSIAANLNTRLDEISDLIDTEVAAILEDTGTTLPATLATIAGYTDGIAGDVWSYKIRTLTNRGLSTETPAKGDPISLVRSATNYLSFTDLGVMTDQTKLWITFKTNNDDADSSAIMQIEVTDGLIVLNGSSTLPTGITATEASITVDDASVGSITVRIDQLVADVLPTLEAYPIYFDIKQLLDDDVNLLYQGEAYIFATSTHTIS